LFTSLIASISSFYWPTNRPKICGFYWPWGHMKIFIVNSSADTMKSATDPYRNYVSSYFIDSRSDAYRARLVMCLASGSGA
jgi:hypothetical protein